MVPIRHMQTQADKRNTYRSGPNERGFFGLFGGRFVAETLMPLILELERAYDAARADPSFQKELAELNQHYAGRPPSISPNGSRSIFAKLRQPAAAWAAPRSTSSATNSIIRAAIRSTIAW